jgi:hypothetical protein
VADVHDEAIRRAAVDAFNTRLDAPVVALRSDDTTGAGHQWMRRLSFHSPGTTFTVEIRHLDGDYVIHLVAEPAIGSLELWGPEGLLTAFEPEGAGWQTRTSFTGPVRGVVFHGDDGDRSAVLQTEWFALR